MRYRLLTQAPFALVAALIVALAFLDPQAQVALLIWSVRIGKLLGAAGCLAAALSFEPGDYLRRAWGLLSFNMFLLARDLPLSLLPAGASNLDLLDVVNQGCVVVANVAGLYAVGRMARAWQVAGLAPPGSPWRRRAVIAVALTLALAITGIPLARHALTWLEGGPLPPRPIIYLVSGITDTLSICLIAPVLLTALAMRGGILFWPWGLYMGAMICWLLYDAGDMASQIMALHALHHDLQIGRDVIRLLACVLTCSAGIAQRWVVLGVQQR